MSEIKDANNYESEPFDRLIADINTMAAGLLSGSIDTTIVTGEDLANDTESENNVFLAAHIKSMSRSIVESRHGIEYATDEIIPPVTDMYSAYGYFWPVGADVHDEILLEQLDFTVSGITSVKTTRFTFFGDHFATEIVIGLTNQTTETRKTIEPYVDDSLDRLIEEANSDIIDRMFTVTTGHCTHTMIDALVDEMKQELGQEKSNFIDELRAYAHKCTDAYSFLKEHALKEPTFAELVNLRNTLQTLA